MGDIAQQCNQLVENLAEFLSENEFKPYKDFDYAFEKIINNDKQAIKFRVVLNSNKPQLIYCVIDINKMLSKQQKSKIIEFINKLSGTYHFFSFHFKENSNESYSLYCRLTWYSDIKDTTNIITGYHNFESKILKDVYPMIIKFLSEL